MIKKIKSFLFFSSKLKFMIFQSIILSIAYEFWLKKSAFSKIKELHQSYSDQFSYEYTEVELSKIKYISKAIKILKLYAPWRPECYNLALTARKLLLKNSIPSVLTIGFKNKDGAFHGHAWVKCNNIIVSGYVADLNTFNIIQ